MIGFASMPMLRHVLLFAVFFACPIVVGQHGQQSEPFEPFAIVAHDAHHQESAVVSGDFVVWIDYRDYPAGRGKYSELYFYDATNGETKRLTDSVSKKLGPRIQGDWVVWSDDRHGNLDLYGMSLIDGQERRLTHAASNQTAPDIDYPWVIYQDDRVANQRLGVRILNVETGQANAVGTNATMAFMPRIGNGIAVWIEVSTIVDGVPRGRVAACEVQNCKVEHLRLTGQQSSPDVDQGLLVWTEIVQGGSNIAAYKWATGETISVVELPGFQQKPQVSFPSLLWMNEDESRGEAATLYYRDLRTADAPVRITPKVGNVLSASVGPSLAAWVRFREGGGVGTWDVWGTRLREGPVASTDALNIVPAAAMSSEKGPDVDSHPPGIGGSLPFVPPLSAAVVLGAVAWSRWARGPRAGAS